LDTSLPTPVSKDNTWVLVSKQSKAATKMKGYERMNAALKDMVTDNVFEKLSDKYGSKGLVLLQ
jgi:hypothetical protein